MSNFTDSHMPSVTIPDDKRAITNNNFTLHRPKMKFKKKSFHWLYDKSIAKIYFKEYILLFNLYILNIHQMGLFNNILYI